MSDQRLRAGASCDVDHLSLLHSSSVPDFTNDAKNRIIRGVDGTSRLPLRLFNETGQPPLGQSGVNPVADPDGLRILHNRAAGTGLENAVPARKNRKWTEGVQRTGSGSQLLLFPG